MFDEQCPFSLLGFIAPLDLLSDDSDDDSSDSAHCPTSDPESTNTPADTKGTAMFDEQSLLALLGLLAPLGLP